MKNREDSLFEARLRATLKAQPRATLPAGFAARLRANAETSAVSSLLGGTPYHAVSANLMLSRVHLFVAAALFVASFAAGTIYADAADSRDAESHKVLQSEPAGQSEDPLLNSLYYAHQRIL
ncbi:MAG: hypothetical protein IPI58_00410 [Alphaproteobacteria bacterium]|nr:MAG: hypothetical protein IPI58_00410 [Alphaproteobacteria bacterium]